MEEVDFRKMMEIEHKIKYKMQVSSFTASLLDPSHTVCADVEDLHGFVKMREAGAL